MIFQTSMIMFHVNLPGCKPAIRHVLIWDDWCTLQGINISHLGERKIIFKMPFWGDMLVPWRVCPSLKRSSPVGTQRRKGFKLQLRTQKIANTSFFMGTWGYPMPTPPLLPGYWPSLSLNNQLNKALFPVGGDGLGMLPFAFHDFLKILKNHPASFSCTNSLVKVRTKIAVLTSSYKLNLRRKPNRARVARSKQKHTKTPKLLSKRRSTLQSSTISLKKQPFYLQ